MKITALFTAAIFFALSGAALRAGEHHPSSSGTHRSSGHSGAGHAGGQTVHRDTAHHGHHAGGNYGGDADASGHSADRSPRYSHRDHVVHQDYVVHGRGH